LLVSQGHYAIQLLTKRKWLLLDNLSLSTPRRVQMSPATRLSNSDLNEHDLNT